MKGIGMHAWMDRDTGRKRIGKGDLERERRREQECAAEKKDERNWTTDCPTWMCISICISHFSPG